MANSKSITLETFGGVAADLIEATSLIVELAMHAVSTQQSEILEISKEIVNTFLQGGKVYTFGAGHAQAFAMELTSRAGGLSFYQSMNLQDIRKVVRDSFWDLRDSKPERIPANGIALLDHHGVGVRDMVIIASQSGRNGAPIEMALECRRRGIRTVGISSLEHMSNVASRHESGKKLIDVVDQFLNNGSVLGDAVIRTSNEKGICSASSVCFALLAQGINFEVTRTLIERGVEPPILVSANLDHGDKNNLPFKQETPPSVS
jgi:uncharacterized phosphosugar-binding protein